MLSGFTYSDQLALNLLNSKEVSPDDVFVSNVIKDPNNNELTTLTIQFRSIEYDESEGKFFYRVVIPTSYLKSRLGMDLGVTH